MIQNIGYIWDYGAIYIFDKSKINVLLTYNVWSEWGNCVTLILSDLYVRNDNDYKINRNWLFLIAPFDTIL